MSKFKQPKMKPTLFLWSVDSSENAIGKRLYNHTGQCVGLIRAINAKAKTVVVEITEKIPNIPTYMLGTMMDYNLGIPQFGFLKHHPALAKQLGFVTEVDNRFALAA